MFEFILFVSLLNDFSDEQYVGRFKNCDIAMEYKQEHFPEHKSSKCLREDVINSQDLIKIIEKSK